MSPTSPPSRLRRPGIARSVLFASAPGCLTALTLAFVMALQTATANSYRLTPYLALDRLGSSLSLLLAGAFVSAGLMGGLCHFLVARGFEPKPLYLGSCLVSVLTVVFLFFLEQDLSILIDTDAGDLLPRALIYRDRTILVGLFASVVIMSAASWISRPLRSRAEMPRGSEWRPDLRTAIAAVCAVAAIWMLTWLAEWRLRPNPPADWPNVVFIAWDSVRADHLASYGYSRVTTPNLESFVRDSVLFEQAVSQFNWTRPSFASILTSQLGVRLSDPLTHQAIRSERFTLAEILKNQGYRTLAVVQNPNLDARFGFRQGFEHFVHIINTDVPESVNDAAFNCLREWARDPRPFFAFLHFQEPHWPYQIFSSGELPQAKSELSESEIRELMTNKRVLDPSDPESRRITESLVEGYDHDLRLTDGAFGQLIEFLTNLGLVEKSVIVFMSDHGDEFFEHAQFGHGHANIHPEVTFVPLLIRFPESAGVLPTRVSGVVRNLDIMPTVLDLLDLSPPESVEGESLLPLERLSAETRLAFSQWDESIYSIRDNRFTVLARPSELSGLTFFDRQDDKLEQRPLRESTETETLRLLGEKGRAYFESRFVPSKIEGEGTEPLLDTDLEEKLRALGYVE